MKKRNSFCDYIKSRNDSLYREFVGLLGSKGSSLQSVFEMLAQVPAPRFFISEDRAFNLIKRFFATGKWPRTTLLTRRAMLSEIATRVRVLQAFDSSLSLKDAVFRAVNSPAPSFYLTPRSIRTILYGYIHSKMIS